MNRKSRGALLIEIIVALSIFALVAGMVTRTFLIGLELQKANRGNSNEAIIKTTLINRIKQSHASPGSVIVLPLSYGNSGSSGGASSIPDESWKLEVISAQKLDPFTGNNDPNPGTGLYRLEVKIYQGDAYTPVPRDAPTYKIFRYLKA